MIFSQIPSPCFVLDEKRLRHNLTIAQTIRQQTGVQIVVALKGFALWKAFPTMRNYLDGAAASSLNEARLCFEEMKTLAHTYAVVYNEAEFEQILSFSSHITFNSLSQFEKCTPSTRPDTSGVSAFKQHKISCGLRINPEFSNIKNLKNDPTAQGSRLGLGLDFLKKNGLPDGIEGLHVHCLSEATAVESGVLLTVLKEKLSEFLPKLKWLNIGGGHFFTQKDYDLPFFMDILRGFKQQFPKLDLILEPSTAIGFEAGFLRATVLDIVEKQGFKTLMTDTSFVAHLPNSSDFDTKPRIKGAILGKNGHFIYRISGASGLKDDCLTAYSFEKKVQIGDALIFDNALNYSMVKTPIHGCFRPPFYGILKENGIFESFE